MDSLPTTRFSIATLWGLIGVLFLLGSAIAKLLPLALEPIQASSWSAGMVLAYIFSIIFMAYTEGYKGFQKNFSPRVVARAFSLNRSATWIQTLFAPAFCMGLFHARVKRMIISWAVVFGVTLLVLLMPYVPQPWRGAVDAGVVVGLTWGVIAIFWSIYLTRKEGKITTPLDVPLRNK